MEAKRRGPTRSRGDAKSNHCGKDHQPSDSLPAAPYSYVNTPKVTAHSPSHGTKLSSQRNHSIDNKAWRAQITPQLSRAVWLPSLQRRDRSRRSRPAEERRKITSPSLALLLVLSCSLLLSIRRPFYCKWQTSFACQLKQLDSSRPYPVPNRP